jgi:S1-C subfamily serine protease
VSYKAIYSTSGTSAGVGFAIPVDTLKYEVNTIIRDGKVSRPALGIKYLDSSQARSLGIVKG